MHGSVERTLRLQRGISSLLQVQLLESTMESNRLVASTGPPVETSGGQGSSLDTILNIVNIAFGAGMLGLPYAIQGSGFISGVFGLGIVLVWNFICCALLIELRSEVLKARTHAPKVCALSLHTGEGLRFKRVSSDGATQAFSVLTLSL